MGGVGVRKVASLQLPVADLAYFKLNKRTSEITAPRPMTAAAMPRPTSRPLTLRALAGAGGRAGAGGVAPGGRAVGAPVLVGGRETEATVTGAPAAVGGRGAAGAATPMEEGGAEGADGPPAGRVGSLMVGEDVGLGGRLMRTVSFFGCTLAASGGFGGMGAPDSGLVSDIILFAGSKLGSPLNGVKLFLGFSRQGGRVSLRFVARASIKKGRRSQPARPGVIGRMMQ